MKRMLSITTATVMTVALTMVVLMANAQQVSTGDPNLSVNGSPVLTAATSGGLSGTIVSASGVSSSPGAVYTTPSTGNFILTSFCLDGPVSAVVIGSTFGRIVRTDTACTRYEPGLALPNDEDISVSSITGVAHITLTGVLQP